MMIAIWFFQSCAVFALRIVVMLLGLPLVAIGIPFRREFPETRSPFTQFTSRGDWMLVRLPWWLRPWDNESDGLYGDKRGYWSNVRDGQHASFLSMWLWAAVRNPANYFSRNTIAIDVTKRGVVKLWGDDDVIEEPGHRNAQFLRSGNFYRLFVSWALPGRPDKAFMIDIGWKMKLEHNSLPADAPEKERLRGFTFTISPWKHLV